MDGLFNNTVKYVVECQNIIRLLKIIYAKGLRIQSFDKDREINVKKTNCSIFSELEENQKMKSYPNFIRIMYHEEFKIFEELLK